jgi:hypothetical protein
MRKMPRRKRIERLIRVLDLRLDKLAGSPAAVILLYPGESESPLSGSEFRALIDAVEHQFETSDGKAFTTLLRAYMTVKKTRARDLYSAALIEKSYFYQILSGKHIPARDTVIRIALGLKISLEESRKLLQALGYCFFEKNRRDIIIMTCIENQAGLYVTEMLLDRYGEISLCKKTVSLNE